MSTLWLRREDYSVVEGWALVEWCIARGASAFQLSILGTPGHSDAALASVKASLSPFVCSSLGERARYSLSGGGLEALRRFLPDGLFMKPDWSKAISIEDPSIYRDGLPMLVITSHEEEGTLEIAGEEERDFMSHEFRFHAASRSSSDPKVSSVDSLFSSMRKAVDRIRRGVR